MKTCEFRTKYNDIYIIPFSDIHIGDKGFTKKSENKLKGYIKWVKETPNAFAVLNGDILNVATQSSKSSVFDQDMTLQEQIDKAGRLFSPIRDKILGAIDGNHEQRLSVFSGYSPTISICEKLKIPYFNYSVVYFLRLGLRTINKAKNTHSTRATFTMYAHHTTGGGGSTGSKINRVTKLSEIIPNADCYIGSHNHALIASHEMTMIANQTTGKVDAIRQMFVDTGSYLDWDDGYAEMKQLSPAKLGSPKIHFITKQYRGEGRTTCNLVKKDIHVSI